jgi:putative hydrolase of the HAD superfamily
MPQHIFFDFFGTLVSYSPSRRDQGYEVSHRTLREAGASHEYEAFLDLWCEVSDQFELKVAPSQQEFSMQALGSAFLERALGMPPSEELTSRFR